jgi:hypothetical protein
MAAAASAADWGLRRKLNSGVVLGRWWVEVNSDDGAGAEAAEKDVHIGVSKGIKLNFADGDAGWVVTKC